MEIQEKAREFLIRHHMHYEQMPMQQLIERCEEDIRRSLKEEINSYLMLPSYIFSDAIPRRNESVLVVDAGGSNLRVGRIHLDAEYRPVIEKLEKQQMPGAGGQPVSVEHMFSQMAAFALPFASGCSRAAISFSYPFDSLPSGEGRIRHLCKELQVTGCEGSLICSPLESELKRLGATGSRNWVALNDTVGSLLGGIAMSRKEEYQDYVGLILGTGYNTCCCVSSSAVTKDSYAASAAGEMVINMEAGNFHGILQGNVDLLMDANSDYPGDHIAEKMISGGYIHPLLKQTLILAAQENIIETVSEDKLRNLDFTGAQIDSLLQNPQGENAVTVVFDKAEDRAFCADVADALFERAARLAAANLCAIFRFRNLPEGSRVCICADGTTIRRNPVLKKKIMRYLQQYSRVKAEFLFLEDATLLGSAWAGLLER